MIAVSLLVAVGVAVWLLDNDASHDEADSTGRVPTVAATPTVDTSRVARLPPPAPKLPDVPRPGEEDRKLPAGWNANIRSAPSESVTMRRPSPGEEAPVRAYRFVPDEQPPAAPPPNPLVPAKQDLSEDELRAGLAE